MWDLMASMIRKTKQCLEIGSSEQRAERPVWQVTVPRNLDSRPGVHILPANRLQSISVRRLLWLLNSKPEKMTLLGLVNPYFIGPSIWAVRFALLQLIWASLPMWFRVLNR